MFVIRPCTLRYVVSSGFRALGTLVAHSLSQSMAPSGSKPGDFQCAVVCDQSAMCLLSAGSGDDAEPMMTQAASVGSQDIVGTMSV